MNNQVFTTITAFFISGMIIGIIFDVFRITRKSFKIPNIITYIEDVLFWICTGGVILFSIFRYADGQIRLYMICILIFGAFVYFGVLSKYFIKINTKIIDFLKFIINLIIKIIRKPFEKLVKVLNKIKKINFFTKTSAK